MCIATNWFVVPGKKNNWERFEKVYIQHSNTFDDSNKLDGISLKRRELGTFEDGPCPTLDAK